MHLLHQKITGSLLLICLLAGCSSTPKEPAPAAAPAPPALTPAVIDAGFDVESATGAGVIDSVDKATRRVVIKRPDGSLAGYIAGPEVVNFDQLKTGDEVVANVTESCAFFVVKGGGALPGVAGATVMARAPKGATPGAMALSTRDYNATILDVDLDHRKVLLKYGANDATSVRVGPNVDLSQIAIGDEVLVRMTEAMAITVVKP